jgi:hypothetical protein
MPQATAKSHEIFPPFLLPRNKREAIWQGIPFTKKLSASGKSPKLAGLLPPAKQMDTFAESNYSRP